MTNAIVSKKSATCKKKPKCGPDKFITPDGKQCVEIKYIGRGSYGCVISPPILDNTYILKNVLPYTSKDNDDVAKLFFRSNDFKEELKFSKIIEKIDPDNKFTVKLKGGHKISGKCIQLSESIMYCLRRKIRDVENAKFNQMIMENGGLSLNTSNQYSISYQEFLNIFKEFISGMMILQKNNVVHRDIKPHNVLIDMQKKKLNLIDFSLMCQHYKELYDGKDGNMSLLKSSIDYVYYPPEFYVAYIMLKYKYFFENNKAAFDKFLDSIYSKMHEKGFFEQEKLLIDTYFRQEYEYGVQSFLQTIKNSGFTKCSDIFTKEIAMKADVYAVASIITSLSNNIRYTSHSQQQFVDYIYQKCIRANPYERVSFTELYSIISSEQMKSSVLSNNTRLISNYNKRGGSRSRGQSKNYSKSKSTNTSRITKISNTIASKLTNMKSKIKSKIKSTIMPYMALSVSKMRNIFNREHSSPRKNMRSIDLPKNSSRTTLNKKSHR